MLPEEFAKSVKVGMQIVFGIVTFFLAIYFVILGVEALGLMIYNSLPEAVAEVAAFIPQAIVAALFAIYLLFLIGEAARDASEKLDEFGGE